MMIKSSIIFCITALSLLVSMPLGLAAQNVPDVGVRSLELDRTTVTLACAPGKRPLGAVSCNDSRTVRAKAEVSGRMAKDSHLKPTVTGGRATRINDREFDWDLSGVGPGIYVFTMSAVTKDGEYGGSQTATVTVKECNCGYVDECHTLTVKAPDGPVKAGEKFAFTANVTGLTKEITYNWSISAGSIVSGQGTASIVVETDSSLSGSSVTATVDISDPGGLQCGTTASETVAIR